VHNLTKKIQGIFSSNLNKHSPISITFGRTVTEKYTLPLAIY